MSLWHSLRASVRLLLVSRGVTVVGATVIVAIVVGVSAVDVIVGGWMRFVSGLLRVAIAVLQRMRMRRWTLRLRGRRLSR